MHTHITLENKEIILIGTAHVSQSSIDEVKSFLDEFKPDAIAIELDDERFKAMMDTKKWQEMDIVQIIKQKKTGFLLAQMILSSYQRKIASQFNVKAGDEMKVAIDYANLNHVTLYKIDRSINATLFRIWRALGFIEKMKLLTESLTSFLDPKVNVEDIEKLKEQDMLQAALADVSQQFPIIAETLIFERDRIMAQKLRQAKGKRIVAVVGAAHVPGILEHIYTDSNIESLLKVPDVKKSSKLIQWIFPVGLTLLIVLSVLKTPDLAFNTLLRFILINGSLAALGTALAFGHPLSILTAFVMAPIGTLSPVLATGWFAGLMEAWVHKPKVDDFMTLQDDLMHIKGYWKNRVVRILLVVFLANLFASLGSIVYSIELIKNLLP